MVFVDLGDEGSCDLVLFVFYFGILNFVEWYLY